MKLISRISRVILASVFGALSVFMSSCYYDNQEELYPAAGNTAQCDTSNVTFSAQVSGILNNNCLLCHGTGSTTGIELNKYNVVKAYADNGKLLGVINQAPGFKPMPQGGNKLAVCDIAIITAWVNAGAINN